MSLSRRVKYKSDAEIIRKEREARLGTYTAFSAALTSVALKIPTGGLSALMLLFSVPTLCRQFYRKICFRKERKRRNLPMPSKNLDRFSGAAAGSLGSLASFELGDMIADSGIAQSPQVVSTFQNFVNDVDAQTHFVDAVDTTIQELGADDALSQYLQSTLQSMGSDTDLDAQRCESLGIAIAGFAAATMIENSFASTTLGLMPYRTSDRTAWRCSTCDQPIRRWRFLCRDCSSASHLDDLSVDYCMNCIEDSPCRIRNHRIVQYSCGSRKSPYFTPRRHWCDGCKMDLTQERSHSCANIVCLMSINGTSGYDLCSGCFNSLERYAHRHDAWMIIDESVDDGFCDSCGSNNNGYGDWYNCLTCSVFQLGGNLTCGWCMKGSQCTSHVLKHKYGRQQTCNRCWNTPRSGELLLTWDGQSALCKNCITSDKDPKTCKFFLQP